MRVPHNTCVPHLDCQPKNRSKSPTDWLFLVPDFASTAHMIQGQSLLAAFVDLDASNNSKEDSTEEQYLKAYVMLSRAKVLDNLWILRPFAKDLFQHGPPTGPHILMKKLKNQLTKDQVYEEFDKATESEDRPSRRTQGATEPCLQNTYQCTQCLLSQRNPYMFPPALFWCIYSRRLGPMYSVPRSCCRSG